MNDLFEGNTNIFEDTDTDTPTPSRKLNMGKDKDVKEFMTLLKAKAINDLYKSDPLVRQGIDAQLALDAVRAIKQAKESNVKRDALGNVSGVAHSVVSGAHATVKNQRELALAIQAETYKRYGVE